MHVDELQLEVYGHADRVLCLRLCGCAPGTRSTYGPLALSGVKTQLVLAPKMSLLGVSLVKSDVPVLLCDRAAHFSNAAASRRWSPGAVVGG